MSQSFRVVACAFIYDASSHVRIILVRLALQGIMDNIHLTDMRQSVDAPTLLRLSAISALSEYRKVQLSSRQCEHSLHYIQQPKHAMGIVRQVSGCACKLGPNDMQRHASDTVQERS